MLVALAGCGGNGSASNPHHESAHLSASPATSAQDSYSVAALSAAVTSSSSGVAAADPARDGSGHLSGKVEIGGVVLADRFELVFYLEDGKTIAARTTTNARGAYSLSLQAGNYVIFLPRKNDNDKLVRVRQEISLAAGEEQILDLTVDRGGK